MEIAENAGFENFEIVDYLGKGVFIIGLDEKFYYINKPLLKKLKITKENLRQRSFVEFVAPDDREYARAQFNAIIAGEKVPPFLVRYCTESISGTVEVNAHLLKGEKGIVGIVGTLDPFKEQSLNLIPLIELLPFPVAIFSIEGVVEYINPVFVEFFGYSLDDVPTIQHWFLKAYPNEQIRNQLIQELETDISFIKKGLIAQKNVEVHCKDGIQKKVRMNIISLNSQRMILVVDCHTTELDDEKLKERFYNKQRMETFNILAGIFAHDFNNILSGILGNISLLKRICNERFDGQIDEALNILTDIEVFVRQGSSLTKNFLSLAKGRELEKTTFDVNELIRESAALFGRLHKEITIFYELCENQCFVFASRAQIEQALFNLYINAHQAMPSGGVLHLTTGIVEVDNFASQKEKISPGKYVLISIRDTGCGMDATTAKKIFDPFFSTKPKELSSGLGLASVREIVKKSGGTITVESTPGIGTHFVILLPVDRNYGNNA